MVKLHCEFCITFIWLSVSFTEAEKCHWDGTRGSGVMLWLMHNKREQDFHLRTTRTPALRMLLRYFQHLSDFLWTFISPHLAFKAERQISLQVPTKEFWGKNINTSSGTTPRSSMFLPITAKDGFFFFLIAFCNWTYQIEVSSNDSSNYSGRKITVVYLLTEHWNKYYRSRGNISGNWFFLGNNKCSVFLLAHYAENNLKNMPMLYKDCCRNNLFKSPRSRHPFA